jgi:hypothetical protein
MRCKAASKSNKQEITDMASGREDTSEASRLKHVIKASKTYNIRDGSYQQMYDFQAFETSLLPGRTPHILQTSDSQCHHASPFLKYLSKLSNR